MTAFSDKRLVVFVVFPNISLLDLAGPLQVFSWARSSGSDPLAYETEVVSRNGGPVPTDTLIKVDTLLISQMRDRAIDTLMIIGGDGVYEAARDIHFVEEVAVLSRMADRVCSVCSGAYLLAATGALNGRRAVTHWEDAKALKETFSDVQVELDPIYIRDDNIWTSAGVTSGIDMSLAILAEDIGQKAALERARALVTYMIRPGGQSQFSPALERQSNDREGRFDVLHAWIADNMQNGLLVEDLADHENMTVRTFHRLYSSTMGRTPAKAVELIRLERVRELLESTTLTIQAIARQCGFKDSERMRRSFLRQFNVSPNDYRKRFGLLR
ncbi:MAG: helix-turn-helix domain-containing protein [Alphaproteobacteria bacterium]|nr:helix-turn-helix domain-containing protein [Alphaproteobacteria bacterium]